jgi:hypothetical protein
MPGQNFIQQLQGGDTNGPVQFTGGGWQNGGMATVNGGNFIITDSNSTSTTTVQPGTNSGTNTGTVLNPISNPAPGTTTTTTTPATTTTPTTTNTTTTAPGQVADAAPVSPAKVWYQDWKTWVIAGVAIAGIYFMYQKFKK